MHKIALDEQFLVPLQRVFKLVSILWNLFNG